MADFLLYIVDREISNRPEEITEQQIGVRVFGRPEGYDSNDDNIVRSYARNLRRRLEEYFSEEGSTETTRIEIPRGGYVPVFYLKGEVPADEPKTGISIPSAPVDEPLHAVGAAITDRTEDRLTEPAQAAESVERAKGLGRIAVFHKRTLYVVGLLSMVAMGWALGYIAASKRSSAQLHPAAPVDRVTHLFWSRLFEEKRDTFIVPTDGGLVMLQRFIKGHVSLEDYANGSYRKESTIAQGIVGLIKHTSPEDTERLVQKVEVIGSRRYTSLADLELTTGLARLPEVVPERLMIRYARDLRIDDLRAGNAVLIGSIDSNPWVNLFQQQLNFQFLQGAAFGGSGIIVNRHPLVGEQVSYASVPNDPSLRTYGVAAYVPNLDGTGHVLIIEGINMAGTQAAGTFVLSPELMRPVIERAMSPNGVIRPFEVLFETSSVAANASRTTILSMRIEPI
jgi:hypothetical protein